MSLLRHFANLVVMVGLAACQPFSPIPPHPYDQPARGAQMSAEGVVLSVEHPRPEDSQSYVHLVVAPGDQKKPLRLVLGPGWFLEQQGLRFAPRDTVHFQGSSVAQDGEAGVRVQRIELGGRSVTLRDDRNHPAWTVSP